MDSSNNKANTNENNMKKKNMDSSNKKNSNKNSTSSLFHSPALHNNLPFKLTWWSGRDKREAAAGQGFYSAFIPTFHVPKSER